MPNKYKGELYPKALRELDDIYRYIYEVLQAPEYALGQLDRLEAYRINEENRTVLVVTVQNNKRNL